MISSKNLTNVYYNNIIRYAVCQKNVAVKSRGDLVKVGRCRVAGLFSRRNDGRNKTLNRSVREAGAKSTRTVVCDPAEQGVGTNQGVVGRPDPVRGRFHRRRNGSVPVAPPVTTASPMPIRFRVWELNRRPKTGFELVAAQRQVSGFTANPSPSSGSGKSGEKFVSLVGLAGSGCMR